MSISPDGSRRTRIQIGYIAGAHGVEGTVRIVPTTDYPDRFFDMDALVVEYPDKPGLSFKMTGVRRHSGKGQLLVSLAGVDDRDAAEKLKGGIITVSPEERVELPEGEYWADSLVGLDVFDFNSGERLGAIDEIMSTGSNDVYRIITNDGTAKLIPAIADVVREISLEKGVMRINVLEGLWD